MDEKWWTLLSTSFLQIQMDPINSIETRVWTSHSALIMFEYPIKTRVIEKIFQL